MAGHGPPSVDELRRLIAEQKNEPDVSRLKGRERADFVDDPNHRVRKEMRARNRRIREGLRYHGIDEADLEQQ